MSMKSKLLEWLIRYFLFRLSRKPGNRDEYEIGLIHNEENHPSPLSGKKIVFLGSSVTLGSAAQGMSFVECIAKQTGCECHKEALGGSTLVDLGPDSYVQRMERRLDPSERYDAFVCQLSTNDATRKLPLGTVSLDRDPSRFDTGSVAGAIEHIVSYVEKTWDCPIVFFTGTPFKSPEYTAMVDLLFLIQRKYGVAVVDLWNDPDFLALKKKTVRLYMADKIHPTKAGYLRWWTPRIETCLEEIISRE